MRRLGRGPWVGERMWRRNYGEGFDPDRRLWTAVGCVGTVLVWAAIVVARGYMVRG